MCGVCDKKRDDNERSPKKKSKKKKNNKDKKEAVSLGVIRLDYDYPPAPGDIDCPDSFAYDVHYRVVPGLTFEMC